MRLAAALLGAALAARGAGAQLRGGTGPDPRPAWRLGGTWVQQSRFLEDGNGVSVHGRRTLAAEGGVSWRLLDSDLLHLRVLGGAQVRVAAPRVEITERADSIGPPRDAGRATVADFMARLEQDGDGILQLHVAAGAAWLRGPRGVAPFRFRGVNGFHEAVELGAAVRVARRPIFVTATLQTFGYGATGDGQLPQRGTVARAMLGARHGR